MKKLKEIVEIVLGLVLLPFALVVSVAALMFVIAIPFTILGACVGVVAVVAVWVSKLFGL